MVLERHRAKEISASTCTVWRAALFTFRDFLKPDTSVRMISADAWENWYRELLRSDKAASTKRRYFALSRSFVCWLVDKGLMDEPRNLHRKRYRFKGSAKAIETCSIETVRAIIASAPERLRCLFYLMLNCGFTQIDCSDLLLTEIDWQERTITRKRSKTSGGSSVPTVAYPLWSETFRLLQKFRNRDASKPQALLTKKGKIWVRNWIKSDGRRHNCDVINSCYQWVSVDGKPTLKVFRATSSTLLGSHPEFHRFAQYFLGHAPSTRADKHYVKPSQSEFNRAVAWLGEQYIGA
jgi:integrase